MQGRRNGDLVGHQALLLVALAHGRRCKAIVEWNMAKAVAAVQPQVPDTVRILEDSLRALWHLGHKGDLVTT